MKINIEKAWGESRQDRWGVMVHIENKGQVFKYMPTYADLIKIRKLLEECEEMNKELNVNKIKGEVPNGF